MFQIGQLHFALPLVPVILGSVSILLIIRSTMRLRSIIGQKRSLQAQEKVAVINDILDQVKAIGVIQKLPDQDQLVQERKAAAKEQLNQLLQRYQTIQKVHDSSNGGIKA